VRSDPIVSGYRQAQSRQAADDPHVLQAFKAVLLLIVTLVLARGVWMLEDGFNLNPGPVTDSPPTNVYGSFGMPIASPISIAFPDTLVIVTQTPAATPMPTPTYAMSTAVPPVICGPWLTKGQTCEMSKLPDPTPTPLSACPVAPQATCVWTGRAEDASPVAPPPFVTAPQQ
jgi:hypothetical protein